MRTSLLVLAACVSVVVSIAGCQSQAQVEPDDPTDEGGAERGASCPAMIDVSCNPRGNASDRDKQAADDAARAACDKQYEACGDSQKNEVIDNFVKCIMGGCTFSGTADNDVDTKCRPTNPGQPCFYRHGAGMYVCSYMGEYNFDDYTCE